jgi:hypothetical protein
MNEAPRSWAGGRTVAQILASIAANPVDWDPTFVSLFLKSQRVKKMPAAYSQATKGQIVTNVSYNAMFEDQVFALYLEKCILANARRNVYLHCRSPFATMAKFYRKHWVVGREVTYVDYTSWDTNVNEAFTELYANVLRSYGVDPAYVDRFVHRRLNSRSFLGPMPAMQFSGDRYTWIANTIGDMAFTGISFAQRNDMAFCFSGDDMIACGTPKYILPNPASWGFSPKLTTAATGEFCGYIFGDRTLHISSAALLHRGRMALEDGRNDRAYWTSFDMALHQAQSPHALFPDPLLTAAIAISHIAHTTLRVPRTRFSPPDPTPYRA